MKELRTGRAEPADAERIRQLFRSGFRPEVMQLLIYGQHGAAEYIRMQIARAGEPADTVYFVAHAAEAIAGAVEMRQQPDGCLLSYIAVDPEFRGQGIGSALLSTSIEMTGARGSIALDVLRDNAGARQWYGRLGFTGDVSREFVELAPPGGPDDGPVYVSGLPQADLSQARFGFSSFELIAREGTFRAGRMGAEWFRLTDPAAVRSPAVFAALAGWMPNGGFLRCFLGLSLNRAQILRSLATTIRLEMAIGDLMRALSQ